MRDAVSVQHNKWNLNLKLFTSESVSAGHPDKLCDQISDTILDAVLAQDATARVAVETMAKDNTIVLGGELNTFAVIDIKKIVRDTIKGIGYVNPYLGFSYNTCTIIDLIGKQSPEIHSGVDEQEELGAGDQGIMFGYATTETENYMPLAINLAHKLIHQHSEFLAEGECILLPDAKAQVTVAYNDVGDVTHIDTIVFSSQHNEHEKLDYVRKRIKEDIIELAIPENLITDDTKFLINPAGAFTIGGPVGDAGLTGRKIIVDTYGGASRHGGGAFSGKDATKVDRSAAYAARYVAKNVVAAGLAQRCEVQLSYAIGYPKPVSISVDTFGTTAFIDSEIERAIQEVFDLSPQGIIDALDLLQPIYQKTASGGHFGREEFTWEQTDKVDALLEAFAK